MSTAKRFIASPAFTARPMPWLSCSVGSPRRWLDSVGDIVVDQEAVVKHLECRRRAHAVLEPAAERHAARDDERRPQPLALARHVLAHKRVEVALRLLSRNQRQDLGDDPGLAPRHGGDEVVVEDRRDRLPSLGGPAVPERSRRGEHRLAALEQVSARGVPPVEPVERRPERLVPACAAPRPLRRRLGGRRRPCRGGTRIAIVAPDRLHGAQARGALRQQPEAAPDRQQVLARSAHVEAALECLLRGSGGGVKQQGQRPVVEVHLDVARRRPRPALHTEPALLGPHQRPRPVAEHEMQAGPRRARGPPRR